MIGMGKRRTRPLFAALFKPVRRWLDLRVGRWIMDFSHTLGSYVDLWGSIKVARDEDFEIEVDVRTENNFSETRVLVSSDATYVFYTRSSDKVALQLNTVHGTKWLHTENTPLDKLTRVWTGRRGTVYYIRVHGEEWTYDAGKAEPIRFKTLGGKPTLWWWDGLFTWMQFTVGGKVVESFKFDEGVGTVFVKGSSYREGENLADVGEMKFPDGTEMTSGGLAWKTGKGSSWHRSYQWVTGKNGAIVKAKAWVKFRENTGSFVIQIGATDTWRYVWRAKDEYVGKWVEFEYIGQLKEEHSSVSFIGASAELEIKGVEFCEVEGMWGRLKNVPHYNKGWYELDEKGVWEGEELVVMDLPHRSSGVGEGEAIQAVRTGAPVKAKKTYRCRLVVDGYKGSGDVGFVTAYGLPLAGARLSGNGRLDFEFTADADGEVSVFTRKGNACVIREVSVRRVLS